MSKKPKMPKANASLQAWKNYENRLKAYDEKKKLIQKIRNKRASL